MVLRILYLFLAMIGPEFTLGWMEVQPSWEPLLILSTTSCSRCTSTSMTTSLATETASLPSILRLFLDLLPSGFDLSEELLSLASLELRILPSVLPFLKQLWLISRLILTFGKDTLGGQLVLGGVLLTLSTWNKALEMLNLLS